MCIFIKFSFNFFSYDMIVCNLRNSKHPGDLGPLLVIFFKNCELVTERVGNVLTDKFIADLI